MKAMMKLILDYPSELPMSKLVAEGNCMIMLVTYENQRFRVLSVPTNEHLV